MTCSSHFRRAILCLCLALQASVGVPGQTGQASPAREMERDFQAALAAEDRGDLHTAETILVSLRARNPRNFAINETLGLLLAAAGRYDDALPALQAAAREDAASDVAHTNLGAVYFHLSRLKEASTEFQTAVRINPRNLTAHTSLGQVWMELHRPEQAAESYAAALALEPENRDVLEACAEARVAAGQLDVARTLLERMPEADRSALAQSLLGDIDEKRGAFLSAAQHYGRAAHLEPTEQNAWMVGVEFLRHWTFAPAVQEFEAAAARFPASTRMRLGLGAAYFGNGQYPEAIRVFADLLEGAPDDAVYAEFLGMSCGAALQQKQPRCLDLVRYARAHPGDAKAAMYAAVSLKAQEPEHLDVGLVFELLSRAMAADEKLPEAQYQMGLLLQDEDKWNESIAYLERAVALKPDYAQAHYRLALAYWRGGRKQEGQEQIDLQKKYAQQGQRDLDQRLRQIVTFRVDSRD